VATHFIIQPKRVHKYRTFNTLRRNYTFGKKYWVNDTARDWNTRKELHKTLIASLATDIICFQEAELTSFDEDFGFVESLGYSAVKPVVKKGEHEHTKPSIFFKTSRFNLKWHNPRTRTLIVQLEDRITSKCFYVVNCHLQGGTGQEDQRCFQVRSALQQLQNHIKSAKLSEQEIICFVCGDFNELYGFPLHTLLKEGQPNAEEITKYFAGKPFNFKHNFGLKDSHEGVPNRPYTFKWGVKDDALYHTIDFIYCSGNKLEVQCIRNPLKEDQDQPMRETIGIPNQWHPSDHLPAAALFKFK